MKSPTPKVLFLIPYPMHCAPSQRFRVENLLPLLDAANISYAIRPFMDESTWDVLYKGGSFFKKAKGILKGFLRRWQTVYKEAKKYDYVFIHREAAPLGPPVFEWYLKKVLKSKIIYDFDDAIWIANTTAVNKLASWVKAVWKVKYICNWSYKISAGNDFLCNYARSKSQAEVVHIPTVVDTDHRYNCTKQNGSDKVTIGWTGSHSTLKFLDEIIPVLQELQKTHDFQFVVIADKKPKIELKNWNFISWQEATEVEDLLKIDIGVMPLVADLWSEGKCGFKIIQYMALGIPAVASPVGVNKKIIDGDNGFLCLNDAEWYTALSLLLSNASLRKEMGGKGRKKIQEQYSSQANADLFTGLFR